ncbi:MAG TPA: hypothetical protein VJT69_13965 [Pyrinomonadaceae bacterium]|nr:hypothetical protein [Pyrinomonadaceae bacterium]
MVSRKASGAKIQQRDRRIVKEIEKKYGKVIDLERSPLVLAEIIREFGRQFDEDDGTGGVSPGVKDSSIAVAGPPDPPEPPPSPPDPPETGDLEAVVTRLLLTMQKDIKALNRKMDKIAATKAR